MQEKGLNVLELGDAAFGNADILLRPYFYVKWLECPRTRRDGIAVLSFWFSGRSLPVGF